MAIKLHMRTRHLGAVSALTLGLSLTAAAPAFAQTMAPALSKAAAVTNANPNEVMSATVWLNMRNRKQLDETVSKLYTQGSTTYHHWLKPSDLAQYAPTDADVLTLKRELAAQGLTVTQTGQHNMFLRVSGKVATLQTAFHTQIQSGIIKGQAVRAATTAPKMQGAAATLVSAITGLSSKKYTPNSIRPLDPDTGKVSAAMPLSSSPKGIFFSGQCFRPTETVTFTTPGAALPISTYIGNRYGADRTNTAVGTLPTCGYSAANVTGAYGMQPAYNLGLNGKGQTIVIIDAFGSSTITKDANAFSQINGLPALDSTNFQIIYPGGAPQATTAANAAGWAGETSLDVEWAHALAPGAAIDLLVSPSDYDTDLSTTLFYAIVNELGSVVSNSYSGFEAEDIAYYPEELDISNLLSELGAAFGISVNYSSGDDGDGEAVIGVKSVSDLGASPYATSVGGNSVYISSKNALVYQTGWGNNITKLASAKGAPLSPPLNEGFIFGAGGGESQYFYKPTWQSNLPGIGRQQPDVSFVADPYTGVEIVITSGGEQVVEVIGGTSLSCPAFSAIWAIANQRAAQNYGVGTLLGQAAPIIASLQGTPAVRDVKPFPDYYNVSGITISKAGTNYYSPNDLAQPLVNTREYVSALYNGASGSWYDLTFGTDSSLTVAYGWDNVTGYGTPTGLAFIEAASQ